MLRERPVARLSAALEGTKPSSSAALATRCRVFGDTEPRPERALDAVDFETPANFATSAKVLIHQDYLHEVNLIIKGRPDYEPQLENGVI